MPRLAGHPERHPFNVWDVVRPERVNGGPPSSVAYLFDRSNAAIERVRSSDKSLCNIRVPGMIDPGDMTNVILGWYARTTVPDTADRADIFHRAVATIFVGHKPMRQLSLAELVTRNEKTEIEETSIDRVTNVATLARGLYEEHANHTPPGRPTRIGGRTFKAFDDLSSNERNRWVAAADVAFRIVKPRPHLIVPVRQQVWVEVENYTAGSNFETWVHLVGLTVRDVC